MLPPVGTSQWDGSGLLDVVQQRRNSRQSGICRLERISRDRGRSAWRLWGIHELEQFQPKGFNFSLLNKDCRCFIRGAHQGRAVQSSAPENLGRNERLGKRCRRIGAADKRKERQLFGLVSLGNQRQLMLLVKGFRKLRRY